MPISLSAPDPGEFERKQPHNLFNDRRKYVATQRDKGVHVEATNDRNDTGGAIYQTDSKEKAIKLHADRIKGMAFAPRNKKIQQREGITYNYG